MMRDGARPRKEFPRSARAARFAHVHTIEAGSPRLSAVGGALDVLTNAVLRDREVRHPLNAGRCAACGRNRSLEAHDTVVHLTGEIPHGPRVEDENLLP